MENSEGVLVRRDIVSEDEIEDLNDELQKITDKFIKKVDKAVEVKTKELMTI